LKFALNLQKHLLLITLSEKSKTVMYDGIERRKWNEFGVTVHEVENINSKNELIKELAPDLIVMCGWRQIVDKEVLDIPKQGMIGFHPTLLPKGRGPAPIINSILQGFKDSGVTMFYAADGLDNGDMIGQEKFTIGDTDYAEDVYNKVIEAGKKLINKFLPLLIEGTAPRKKQNETEATVFEKPENNKIDFEKETLDQIYKKIRALSKPYRGAYIEKNEEKLIIWKAELK